MAFDISQRNSSDGINRAARYRIKCSSVPDAGSFRSGRFKLIVRHLFPCTIGRFRLVVRQLEVVLAACASDCAACGIPDYLPLVAFTYSSSALHFIHRKLERCWRNSFHSKCHALVLHADPSLPHCFPLPSPELRLPMRFIRFHHHSFDQAQHCAKQPRLPKL